MSSVIKSVEEFMVMNNLLDMYGEDDVFIHGVKPSASEGISMLDMVKSFFEKGIRLDGTSKGGSILSTVALQHKDQSLSEQIKKYNYAGGVYKVIVKIPKELEGLYLGNCREKYETGGNQNDKNAILDYLNFESIPREFIVGICVSPDKNDLSKDQIFIENPYYYDNFRNKKQNTQATVEKIKAKLKNHPNYEQLITGGKFDKDDIDFAKHLDDKDSVFFMQQKNRHLGVDDFSPKQNHTPLRNDNNNSSYQPYIPINQEKQVESKQQVKPPIQVKVTPKPQQTIPVEQEEEETLTF